jgi:hypothetical protein
MTIIRLPSPVPRDLPAARLFLDDIEEIVHILAKAGGEQHAFTVRPADDWPSAKIEFSVGNRICDEIEELPQITKSTKNLIVEVSRGSRFTAGLFVGSFAALETHGLSYDERLAVFYRVEDIFKQRRRPWTFDLRKSWKWVGMGTGLVCGFVSGLTGAFLSRIMHKPGASFKIAFGTTVVITAVLIWASTRGSTVIFRKFSEQQELREKKRAEIVLDAIKLVVAFLFGILSLYLKHKYWP